MSVERYFVRELVKEERDLRTDVGQIMQAALAAVAPEVCLRQIVRRDGNRLLVKGKPFNLAQIERIIVAGMGKASARMASSLEEILEERISTGLIVTADGYRVPTQRIEVVEAGHPVPDERGLTAAKRIAGFIDKAGKNDLVIVLISGGGSALLSLPASGITLCDLGATNELFLRSGAKIQELNTVRKHLSQVKGGQLARRAAPAQVVSLVLSDVPGDPLDAIASGPTVLDPTTFQDTEAILKRYSLWERVPAPVRKRIEAGVNGEIAETPKPGDPAFQRVTTVIVGSGPVAAEAARAEGERLGYRTLILTSTLEGEAREVGRFLAALAREEINFGRPVSPPALIIAVGETTVTVQGNGQGGRNQELALSAALGIEGLSNVVICSLGTDGRDGPTDAAGGMVDGGTVSRLRDQGIDPEQSLDRNDSYHCLLKADGLVITGPTGTNVADLCLVAVGKQTD